MIYETNDQGVRGYWEENIHPTIECQAGATPQMIRDVSGALGTAGLYYPSCSATGVVYAPPLSGAALIEMLFPDNWGLVPPG